MITLGIVGVVAALTFPSLIQSYREKATVVQLKKHYSMIQQAYLRAINDNGTADNWNLVANSYNTEENMLYHLKPYLNIIKYCGASTTDCWQEPRYDLNKSKAEPIGRYRAFSKAILSDGSIIATRVNDITFSDDINRFVDCYVDLNGEKGPNVYGKDIFQFYFTRNKVIPFGVPGAYNFDKGWCSRIGTYHSVGCAAWVLQNENMDYLHCDDLSWTGKRSCKE